MRINTFTLILNLKINIRELEMKKSLFAAVTPPLKINYKKRSHAVL